MDIAMIGSGYVGLVSALCFAEYGHNLVCIDKKKDTIEMLSKGKSPIYEKDLDTLLTKNIKNNSIVFTTDYTLLKDCKIVFLAVGTPSLPNGHADLSQVFSAIDEIIEIVTEETMLVVRSTIPVGTMKTIRKYLDSKSRPKQLLGFCPEFLREGLAISDFLNPNYLVFCSETQEGQDLLHRVYQAIIQKADETRKEKVQITKLASFETAELIKYTINSFLAMKITFINQIAQLSLSSGGDMSKIVQTIGADKRIGREFITPGPGFGGSCFPKDTLALVKCGISYGVDLSLVAEVSQANVRHKEFIASWLMESLEQHLRIEKHVIAVWGLTFKAETDDVRDSAAIPIIESFFIRGVRVQAYDPKGSKNFQSQVNNELLSIHDNAVDAVKGASVLLVLTEWKEFSELDPALIHPHMSGDKPFVFDTRSVLNLQKYIDCGFRTYKFGI